MKTRKTLQMLVAVVAMLTMLCSLMPAAYAEQAEEMPSYQASKYYVDSEYTNPNSPWSWDYYDVHTGKYKNLSILNGTTKRYSIVGGYDAVTAIDADEMFGDSRGGKNTQTGVINNGIGVSEWIQPEGSSYAGAWQQYYPVRSFTVPKTGAVTITAADDAITYTGTATGTSSKLSFRIMQDRDGVLTKVWPVDANVYEAGPGNPISFSALNLSVQKGDILRFELYTPEEGTNGTNFIRAKWDPIVTYVPLVTEYQASKEFVAKTSNNPTANWTWNTYVYGDDALTWSSSDYQSGVYTPITKSAVTDTTRNFSNPTLYPIPADDSDNGDLLAISNDGLGIGKYWMRSFKVNTTSGKTHYVGLMSTVRTFTANKAGEVNISAVDKSGKSTIEAAHIEKASDEKNKRGVRVLKESKGEITQLWPEENSESAHYDKDKEAYFALVPANKSIDFPALTANLEAGDKLHFELANVGSDASDKDSLVGCAVYWDPKITYTTGIVVDDDAVTFENESEALTTFESIVNSESEVTVTIPATAHLTAEESVTPIVAVYNQDGVMVSCGLGIATKLSMNVPTNMTVTLPVITENIPTGGYIKVFLWDMANGLKPITDVKPFF